MLRDEAKFGFSKLAVSSDSTLFFGDSCDVSFINALMFLQSVTIQSPPNSSDPSPDPLDGGRSALTLSKNRGLSCSLVDEVIRERPILLQLFHFVNYTIWCRGSVYGVGVHVVARVMSASGVRAKFDRIIRWRAVYSRTFKRLSILAKNSSASILPVDLRVRPNRFYLRVLKASNRFFRVEVHMFSLKFR
jgi:hypothetical protein